jgi:hypothetical protein
MVGRYPKCVNQPIIAICLVSRQDDADLVDAIAQILVAERLSYDRQTHQPRSISQSEVFSAAQETPDLECHPSPSLA